MGRLGLSPKTPIKKRKVSPSGDELSTHPPPALKGGSESPSDVRRAGFPSGILPAVIQLMPQSTTVKGSLSGCPLADAGKARTLDSMSTWGVS